MGYASAVLERTALIVSQTYPPDPAAVGQHMHDVAAGLAGGLVGDRSQATGLNGDVEEEKGEGWRVVTLASAKGYDDPSQRYPRKEQLDGVRVRRLRLSHFGKGSIAVRLLGGLLFCLQAGIRGLLVRRLRVVVVTTSPPMGPLVGLWLRWVRRVPFVFWAMDINPDQMIAMGKTAAGRLPAQLFEWMVVKTLRRAAAVVALDEFMAERLLAKLPEAERAGLQERMVVVPPWPAHEPVASDRAKRGRAFREAQEWVGRFVVMYSGNLSPVHPLDTALDAAALLQERGQSRVLFVFIGGGLGKEAVERVKAERGLENVVTLPYQPVEVLEESLSSADVHLVSMGEAMVGIVHPCKVYGVMAVGRPVVLVGPERSHAGRIVGEERCGYRVDHGDAAGLAELLVRLSGEAARDELEAVGETGLERSRTAYGKRLLCGRFCGVVERAALGVRG
ncbi:MAG: glycosyltransferase family 4 protein [Planctomycetota bacterium]